MILNILDTTDSKVYQFVSDDYYFRSVPGEVEEMVVYGKTMVQPFSNKNETPLKASVNAIKTALNSVYGKTSASFDNKSEKDPEKFSEKPECCCSNNCDNTVTISEKDFWKHQNLEREYSELLKYYQTLKKETIPRLKRAYEKAKKEFESLEKEYTDFNESYQKLLESFI